jgi:formylglycine-generating enzyme required for sulfatase activity
MTKLYILGHRDSHQAADELAGFLSEASLSVWIDMDPTQPARRIKECDVVLVLWSKAAARDATIALKIASALSAKRKFVTFLLDSQAVTPLLESEPLIKWSTLEGTKAALSQHLPVGEGLPVPVQSYDSGPARKNYLAKLAQAFSSVRVLGQGESIPISRLYLPLQLRRRLEGRGVQESFQADQLLHGDDLEAVVLGSPGSGKTTLLKYFTFLCATMLDHPLPIYVRIVDLIATQDSVERHVTNQIQGLIGKAQASALVADEAFCRAGTVLFLDGLDEVSEDDAKDLAKRLSSFRQAYPDSQVVVTSRFSSYESSLLPGFSEFQLEQLTDDDVRAYIYEVCKEKEPENIWSTIRNDTRLLELARTPFILAMMCATPDALGTRTAQRASVYRECTKYLLGQKDWESQRRRKQPVTAENVELLQAALKAIAVKFFKLDTMEPFSQEDLEYVIRRTPHLGALKPRQVLDKIVNNSGLLQRAGRDFHFVHRSIWEFFVAYGMLDEPQDHILARANSGFWEEPIRLYVGLTPAAQQEAVFRALWERNRGLTLRAMTELPEFPDALLTELIQELDERGRSQLVSELAQNVSRLNDPLDAKRTLLDTLTPLLLVERDCGVLFECFSLLEKFSSTTACPECMELINRKLDLNNAGQRRRRYLADSNVRFDLVPVATGQFEMGHDQRSTDEAPRHLVEVSGFWMSQFPTTNGLYYESFPFAKDRRDQRSNEPDQPVTWVTWHEAIIFARWLGCDLPTEAEWEYACRSGGADDEVLFNPDQLDELAWFASNANNRTHPVGLKRANTFGMHDMLGNVREWCKDWFDRDYYKSPTGGITRDPPGPPSGKSKVLRGGAFDWNSANLAPTYRNYNQPDNSYYVNGFRLIFRGADPTSA